MRKLANDFRSKKVPCDVLYLDIDYMDGYRIFTWNKKNFPEPAKMIRDLSRDGFKIAVILDPGIKVDSTYDVYRTGLAGGHFLTYPDGTIYVGKVWPGECAFPDFSNPATREWWGRQLTSLTTLGVRGFWTDMNEPSIFDVPTKTFDVDVVHYDHGLRTPHSKNHNLYGLQMTQATFEGIERLLPHERPFVLTRATFAGGQRYSAVWTGDNVASWNHLRMAVSMCLNLSISGEAFVGTDIGGFIGTPDGELYARWLQFAVFTPLMRSHTEINTPDQEPWSFGKKFETINRKTIELRYRLLPYLYNQMKRASLTGVPPLRPLIFDFPGDRRFIWNETEFMFGDDLLIAPVLSPGERKRTLRLPRGVWFDYWTGNRYEGGGDVTTEAPIERIPMFARAGAIIPTQQVVQYVGEQPINPLTLTVFPAETSQSIYYEDDDNSLDYKNGVSLERVISQRVGANTIELRLSKAIGSYSPPKRSLVVQYVQLEKAPTSVTVGGVRLDRHRVKSLENRKMGWSFDSSARQLVVKVPDSLDEMRIVVTM